MKRSAMAKAVRVLPVAVEEAALLIRSTPDDQRTQDWYETRVRPLVELADKARLGTVSDNEVLSSGLHLQQVNLHSLLDSP